MIEKTREGGAEPLRLVHVQRLAGDATLFDLSQIVDGVQHFPALPPFWRPPKDRQPHPTPAFLGFRRDRGVMRSVKNAGGELPRLRAANGDA